MELGSGPCIAYTPGQWNWRVFGHQKNANPERCEVKIAPQPHATHPVIKFRKRVCLNPTPEEARKAKAHAARNAWAFAYSTGVPRP